VTTMELTSLQSKVSPVNERIAKYPRSSVRMIGTVLLLVALTVCVVPASSWASQAPKPNSFRAQSQGQVSTQTGQPQPQPTGVTSDATIQDILEARVVSAAKPRPCPADQSGEGTSGVDPMTGKPLMCQNVEVQFTEGRLKGSKVIIDAGTIPVAGQTDIVYKEGDTVLVEWDHGQGQPSTYHITDFERTNGMWILAAIFVILAVAFGRVRGFTSLLGLLISFAILVFFVIPRIVAGNDPIITSIIGALGIMVVTLYLSHGFNRKTTAAICGTAISLVFTGLLAWLSLDWLKLTGLGSDEAVYLQIAQGGSINLRGLLLGGIIIGALGVLNDITIGQASAVFEFHDHDPSLNSETLFFRVSNIGRDHIAATVNTLVLAYAGASLPLLILFVTANQPWGRVVNQEIVAQEVVRTLVGSIGLIASVPITTWIASMLAVRTPARAPERLATPTEEAEVEPVHAHSHMH
jgi:uncharacterized membrane protein